jgi:5-methylcytosine-specific restriction endonuclease McrA
MYNITADKISNINVVSNNPLTDSQLESSLKQKCFDERKLTLEIIELLEELDRRKLYLLRGFGSLLEYCVKELKYSESSAYRRISTMRVVRDVPETKTAIQTGSLNLVTVAQAQTFFRAEAKTNKVYSKDDKQKLLTQLHHKSSRQAEKVLLQISPQSVSQEKVRQVTADKTQMTLTISEDLLQKLDRLKTLLSHRQPNCNYTELIETLADMTLQKLDPKVKVARPVKTSSTKDSYTQTSNTETFVTPSSRNATPALKMSSIPTMTKNYNPPAQTRTRYIPAHIRQAVWKNANGQCCYRDEKTGRVCGSQRFLEIDHVQPWSRGGNNTVENLQLLCDAHNRLKAGAIKYL